MSAPRPPVLSRRELLGLALVFLAAFALRAATVLQYTREHPHAEQLVIDEASYERWALEIAGGEWMGREVFFQEPLYPYSLGLWYALFGHERLLARLAQAGLGALTCALVALLGRRVFGAGPGFVAGIALAAYRPALLLPCLFLKENLFLPLLALLAWWIAGAALARPARWLAIGLAGGLGALLRGNVLVLLPFLCAWPFLRALLERERMGRALPATACTFAGVALALLPVAWRNHHVGGVFALTTSGAGTNLYGGNHAENPFGVATEPGFVRGIPEYEAGDWRREAERRLGRALDPAEVSAYWMGEVWRSVRERPATHARILWNKLRLALSREEVPDNHSLAWDARYVALLRLPLPGFGLAGGLGLAGLCAFVAGLLARRRTAGTFDGAARPGIELALLFALYLATVVLTVMSMRARLPLVPLLLPFAGYYACTLAAALRTRASFFAPGGAGWLLLALAPAAAFVLPAVRGPDAPARELAGRDYNLAVQLLEREGRPRAAQPLALALAARDPENPRFQTLLATVEWHLSQEARAAGREDERRELVRSALARLESLVRSGATSPRELSRASRLAGWIQLELASHAAAERHFRRARAFAPDDQELLLGHAEALLNLAERAEDPERRTRFASEAEDLLARIPTSPSSASALATLSARLARLR